MRKIESDVQKVVDSSKNKAIPAEEIESTVATLMSTLNAASRKMNSQWIGCELGPDGRRQIFAGDHDPDDD